MSVGRRTSPRQALDNVATLSRPCRDPDSTRRDPGAARSHPDATRRDQQSDQTMHLKP
jgi:hypothetical protein